MVYLVKEDIILINFCTVKTHGGNYLPPHNFLHEDQLDYLVEVVKSSMFDMEIYPTISDKAAVYSFNIMCNHIFSDGNKRTGLEAALAFLKLNGHNLSNNVTNEILTQFILDIASGRVSLEECKVWFEKNIVLIRK